MRADADFMVYVAARWPSLVRQAVLLGVRPEDAADATADALSRCRRGWARASREEDVDELVRDQLVQAAARRPSTSATGRDVRAEELLVLAPPTLEALKRRGSANNRTILSRAAKIAVPLLLLGAVAGVYLAASGDDEKADRKPAKDTVDNAAVAMEENPAPGVVWYADGQLHLAHSVLAVEGLTDMTRIGAGVVYGDDEGRVVYAADDGSREVLGHKDPDAPVAATDETGWAAWVEREGDRPMLVVKEASTGNEVGATVVDADTRVVALDGETVYFVDATGGHALLAGGNPTVRPVSPGSILDVRSRTRAFQLDDETIQVVQSYFNVEFELPGVGATLSLDGNLVATRLPGADGEVAIYDTRSGKQLQDGLTEDDDALAFAFAPGGRGTIAYVMAPEGLTPGRELQLRTCDLVSTLCKIAARIPNLGGTPVLAR